jgi:hypothetical protein
MAERPAPSTKPILQKLLLKPDSVASTLREVGMEAFFQVAIDDIWSALRARPI